MKRYTLVIQPEMDHSDVDGIRRLRLALKRMLRSLGIRCLHIQEAAGSTETHAEGETR
jgi:hypothetical protein